MLGLIFLTHLFRLEDVILMSTHLLLLGDDSLSDGFILSAVHKFMIYIVIKILILLCLVSLA